MATANRPRIGIIGVGIIAFISHIPAIRAADRAELVAISSRNPEALAQAKAALGVAEAYADWREMLDRSRLDAVIVATSHASHAAPTSESIPAPMREQARQLGVPAFEPASLDTYWRRDPKEMGGGHFADFGSHFSDLALWLGGAPAETVVALSEPKGRPQERYITATARLANGVIVSVSSNDATDLRTNVVIGDRGALGTNTKPGGGAELWLQQGGKREQIAVDSADLSPVAAFIATVLDGKQNLSPAEDAAHVVEFTEAAYRSALEERLVRIERRDASGAGSVTSPASLASAWGGSSGG